MKSQNELRLAIDIGGTFTDTVLMGPNSAVLATTKTPTTPQAPAHGAMQGAVHVLEAAQAGMEQISGFIHGTTLATNALIERRGARVATITSEGFRDILEIAYERRYSQYAINIEKPDLIARMDAAAQKVPQVQAAPLVGFFTDLQARGLKLGVATNDAESSARRHLEAAGVAEMMDFIAGYDSGFGGKPAAGQLHGFCAATGLAADACVMVGDSLHDLHAGRAAGMRTVGVLTGPAPAEELAPSAYVGLASIADLPDWLDEQGMS
mgnify:CR=1 FL=1